MKDISGKSVDMVLTDPPYGTTACKWDVVIPFEPMWEQLKRIIKDNGAICLFGSEPFSSHLRLSNLKQFKYDWIYQKSHAVGFLNCKKQPLGEHEIVSVFNSKVYYPQLLDKPKQNIRSKTQTRLTDSYGNFKQRDTRTIPLDKTYPKSVIKFNRDQKKFHPTQKPVALLEYLVKTYTLENETVLDFTMGSGSTGVACKNLNRKFIGIEKDEKYFEIAKKRIFEQIN
jgi:site-specific DNA-methyltransferase (adenine-specific)